MLNSLCYIAVAINGAGCFKERLDGSWLTFFTFSVFYSSFLLAWK
jgi:hypothetical protein